jgi:hypothetical protein
VPLSFWSKAITMQCSSGFTCRNVGMSNMHVLSPYPHWYRTNSLKWEWTVAGIHESSRWDRRLAPLEWRGWELYRPTRFAGESTVHSHLSELVRYPRELVIKKVKRPSQMEPRDNSSPSQSLASFASFRVWDSWIRGWELTGTGQQIQKRKWPPLWELPSTPVCTHRWG